MILAMVLMAAALLLIARGWAGPSLLGVQVSTFVWVAMLVGLSGVAFGIGDPAANNSALELAPDSIAAITGLRSMFRQIGVSVGSAIMVFCASRASDTASGLEVGYVVIAMACVVNMVLALGIPDRVGGGPSASPPPSSPASDADAGGQRASRA